MLTLSAKVQQMFLISMKIAFFMSCCFTIHTIYKMETNNKMMVQSELNSFYRGFSMRSDINGSNVSLHVDSTITQIRNGFIVLGMHRSGTSMLSGLLTTGFGYNIGEPLVRPGPDNPRGFFELLDVVIQNDEFLNQQNIWWDINVSHYNYQPALTLAIANMNFGSKHFKHGRKALEFLRDPESVPYILKDPRLCITLKSWLPLLNNEPAILFTYRHPMEVAHSIIKRQIFFNITVFTMDEAIHLWIVYNMRALQNSRGLCRVYTCIDDVLRNPMEEVQHISNKLTSSCHVAQPPKQISTSNVNDFLNMSLYHHEAQGKNTNDSGPEGSDCNASTLAPTYEGDFTLYKIAMKLYCDMKNGIAYKDDYMWPDFI